VRWVQREWIGSKGEAACPGRNLSFCVGEAFFVDAEIRHVLFHGAPECRRMIEVNEVA
jgi:hypothetical protein